MSETRISSLLGKITVLLVICCCCLPAQAKYGGGTGDTNDPYLIYTAEQMNAIGADSNDWDKHFKLMADIDLSVFTGTSFNIIGYWVDLDSPDNKPFTGVFDGNGHTISNFTYTSTGTNNIGLFGYVRGDNAEVKDLGLINPDVDAGTGRLVGSLVGWLYNGTISACYAGEGSISGRHLIGGLVGYILYGTITNCYASGSVSGETLVGGLVGDNFRGIITNCYSTGCVSGDSEVGGLMGRNHYGTITNCYSSDSVSGENWIGGLAGSNYLSTIKNCYATGIVSGKTQVGGLVGHNYHGTTSECYSTGSVDGVKSVGGLVGGGGGDVLASFWDVETSGQTTSAGGTGKMTAEMQTMSTFTDAGWGCEPVWTIDEGNDYPRLWWENKPGELIIKLSYCQGSGTEADPYLIYTSEQLNMIGLFSCDWDKHFVLMADIDLGGYTGTSFNIIGHGTPFSGVFDGNGYVVRNLRSFSNYGGYMGLFGCVNAGGEVKNLGLEHVGVYAINYMYIGGLVGHNSGTITNCYTTGGAEGDYYVGGLVGYNHYGTITNCYSKGGVYGNEYLGGLVGYNHYGTITGCYSKGGVYGNEYLGGLVGYNHYGTITDCYSSAGVQGNLSIGGLVGYNHMGTISDCNSTARISGVYNDDDADWEECFVAGGLVGKNTGMISNCRATITVWTGGEMVGGLVGENYEGTISNCYSTGSIGCYELAGGLVGLNRNGTISECYSTTYIEGEYDVGGLVGSNSGPITNCYAAGDLKGHRYVGGLAGGNSGPITNCYSTGSVTGTSVVGGLMGFSHEGTITNCYSTGSVTGTTYVGGLLGKSSGHVVSSYWDIETSGQITSDGGTGKTTAEMQTEATFADAGWDFVGETVNGIEDIWFIPQQDYPHLWWEGMQVPMKLTPRTLNCRSYGNWVKAHITLPEGFTVEDVDPDRPAVLHSFGFESAPLYVFVNKDKVVEIEAAFERQTICSLVGNWPQALTVAGFLTDGNIFLGTSNVRIIHPGMKVIEELAWYWLNEDCVHPTWCDGIDMNRDSLVNLLDYALLMKIEVEFVTDE